MLLIFNPSKFFSFFNPERQTMNALKTQFQSFLRDEDGAQIIEYALLVAVVSLILIALFTALTANGGAFQTWMTNVGTCLSTGVCP
jgi:pilus assembly protein Flp/PilA